MNRKIMQLQSPNKLLDKIIMALALFIISWIFMPALQFLLGAVALWTSILCFLILSIFRGYPLKIVLMFVLVALFIVIHYLTFWSDVDGDAVFSKGFFARILSLGLFFFPIVLSYYYKDKSHYNNLIKVLVFVIIITSLTTIAGLIIFPEATRQIGRADNDYHMYNIAGYGFVYAIVIALPLIIYLIRFKHFNLLLLIICLTLIVQTQFMIAILLAFFAVISTSLLVKISISKTITILAFFVIIGVSFQDTIVSLLYYLASEVAFKPLAERFEEMAGLIKYGFAEGDLDSRFMFYSGSINSFFDNPILGTWGDSTRASEVGGHSFQLDVLGASGLVGYLSLCSIFYLFYRDVLKITHESEEAYPYIRWTMLVFFLQSIVNTSITSPEIGMILFFFIPGISRCFISPRDSANSNNIRSIDVPTKRGPGNR